MADDEAGTMNATWIDPTGVEWPLSDIDESRGYFTTFGPSGWGAPAFEIVTDPIPRGGVEVRYVRTEPAHIVWPLHIYGDTMLEFSQRYRALRNAFVMTAHRQLPGTLRVALADGSARQIDCYYQEGWAGEAKENWLYANPVITLFAPDCYWRDSVAQTVKREHAGSLVNFFTPFPQVSTSQVFGATTIDNNGDVEAWPEWTITGPMSSLIATNSTAGQAFTLTTALTAGQQVTITTQQTTVRGPGDSNLVGSLNWPDAQLWPLLPGTNDIVFTVAGSASGTAIELSFFQRYVGI